MGDYSLTYLYRVGEIVQRARQKLNSLGPLPDTNPEWQGWQFLQLINEFQEDLAQNGYWAEGFGAADITAGVSEVNLRTTYPSMHRVKGGSIQFKTAGQYFLCKNRTEFDRFRETETAGGVFLDRNIVKFSVAPTTSETGGILFQYEEKPPKLGGGTEITLSQVAVTNVGGGVVGLTTVSNDLTNQDSIVISGTTNYNGTYTPLASSTPVSIRITKTYVSETIGANAKCGRYYTPDWPEVHDIACVWYIAKELAAGSERRKEQFGRFASEWKKERHNLLKSVRGPARILPVW